MNTRFGKTGIVAFVSLTFSACGGGKSSVVQPPITITTPLATAIPAGVPYPDSVEVDSSRFYVVPLAPGSTYAVAIIGFEGVLELQHFDGDSTFTTAIAAVRDTSPTVLAATPSSDHSYIRVNGTLLERPRSRFAIVVVPAPNSFGTTSEGSSSTQVEVIPDVPFTGTVATRARSYYQVAGLADGVPHSISLIGQFGFSTLHVYPDQTFSLENDCTLRALVPLECRFTEGGTHWFTVDCGPVNRDGSRYVIVAR